MPYKTLTPATADFGKWTMADGKWFREYTGYQPFQAIPGEITDSAVMVAFLFLGSKGDNPRLRLAEVESLTHDEVAELMEPVFEELKLLATKADEEGEEELPPTTDGTSEETVSD